MIINFENVGKITEKGKFPCAVCRKGVGSNSILCQSSGCWLHNKFSVIRG